MRLFVRPFLMVTLLVGLVLGPAVARAQTTKTPDPAVVKVSDDYTKATLAGDVKAIAALYTDDAMELPPNHPPIKGRAAIEAYYTAEFAAAKLTAFTLTHWESAVHGDAAFDVGAYKQTIKPGEGAAMNQTGKYTVILKKVGGAWKVAYAIYNSDEPPAMPAMK
jgi:uncharacterized protein (TIGR02246 family)